MVNPELKIQAALLKLDGYVANQEYSGYDPYDLLASKLPLEKLGSKICYYLTQLNKRDPFGILRTILFIPKQHVPKGLALFIESYSMWNSAGLGDRKPDLLKLKNSLDGLRSPGYEDKFCWGLNYAYATSLKHVPTLYPSLVVTAYAHRAYFAAAKNYPELNLTNQLESSVRFLLENLDRTEDDTGLCFSYYTIKKDIVYNANAKGGEMLARMFSINGNSEYRDLAIKVMDHTVANQKEDGRWNYRKLKDGTERAQIDFHQLFILECIHKFIGFVNPTDSKYQEAIDKGLQFYLENQVYDETRTVYRWPKKLPLDIHNQASAIITLTRLSDDKPELLETALRIAEFSIDKMQLSNGGFMYQKHGNFSNRTSFIRWGNAWMHLALTSLLYRLRTGS